MRSLRPSQRWTRSAQSQSRCLGTALPLVVLSVNAHLRSSIVHPFWHSVPALRSTCSTPLYHQMLQFRKRSMIFSTRPVGVSSAVLTWAIKHVCQHTHLFVQCLESLSPNVPAGLRGTWPVHSEVDEAMQDKQRARKAGTWLAGGHCFLKAPCAGCWDWAVWGLGATSERSGGGY